MNTKHWLLLTCLAPLATQAEIFISEYVEGGGYNKAIELYNPDANAVDLSQYHLKLFQNGGSSAQYTINLSGTLAAGDVYVIAHNSISDSSQVDLLVGNLQHNGDDAIVLSKNNQYIDVVGRIGEDPGSQWGSGLTSTKDNTLVRLASITNGDNNPDDDFTPSEQWQGFAKDTLTGLGFHHIDGANNNGSGDGSNSGGDDSSTIPDDTDATDENATQCGDEYTPIYAIQGTGLSSPYNNNEVWVEGIVTVNLQDSGYKGFYLQAADTENDNNGQSSEAVFIYDTSSAVNTGDRIRIKATVAEYNQLTQLSDITAFSLCQTDVILPSATVINLPMPESIREQYEGMLVTFEQPLFVTDTYNYGRYGQLGLASERLFNPTQITLPGEDANLIAALNQDKSILLDDGETAQNPDYLPIPSPQLDALNTVRSGDTLLNLTAVMSYSFGSYQLLPLQSPMVEHSNPRPAQPTMNHVGNIRVASFNVLNYFNGDGQGNGFPTARGAKTDLEFMRQREKIIHAISTLNADIIGLMEIENDGYLNTSAIADLVSGLNESYGAPIYQFVQPNVNEIGDDAITVGLIYRTDKVITHEAARILDSKNSALDNNQQPLFLDNKNRPMLAQKFSVISSNANFVVAVNHLKSKGSDCDSLNDPNLFDGQGNCNQTRTRAANAIGQFLTKNYPEQDTLIIGDLNAYAKEDPITMLSTQGYHNIFNLLDKPAVYSYIFGGELGQLDHALANTSMAEKIVDASIWAINADEPRVLDYSTQYQSDLQQSKFYAPDAYRSSDHDPVIVELSFIETTTMFGDFDQDQDIDQRDVSMFYQHLKQRKLTDMAYDFNHDGQLNSRDMRGLMTLCTRNRCL